MITSWVEICKEVAEELNIPEEEVKKEIVAYTTDLRQEAIELSNLEYYLFGLGVLRVRYLKLREFINKIKARITKLKKKGHSEDEPAIERNRFKLEKLQKLFNLHMKIYKVRKSNLRSKSKNKLNQENNGTKY